MNKETEDFCISRKRSDDKSNFFVELELCYFTQIGVLPVMYFDDFLMLCYIYDEEMKNEPITCHRV